MKFNVGFVLMLFVFVNANIGLLFIFTIRKDKKDKKSTIFFVNDTFFFVNEPKAI